MDTDNDLEQLFEELKIYETLWSKDVEKGFLKRYLKKYGPGSLFYKVKENDKIIYLLSFFNCKKSKKEGHYSIKKCSHRRIYWKICEVSFQ